MNATQNKIKIGFQLSSEFHMSQTSCLSVVDGDINFNPGFDRNAGDLLDDIGRSVKIDQTLVDAHFEAIPGVGTFSGRSLTGGDAQLLGRHADRSTDVKLLVEGCLLQVGADLLEVGDIAARKSDANAVDNGVVGGGGLLLESRHSDVKKKLKGLQTGAK